MYKLPSDYDKHISTRVDKTLGYVYFIDKEHPLSDKCGKVYYHRHVYSVKTNQWIQRTLQVHHIDENRANNDPSNLEACSRRQHQRKHSISRGHQVKKVATCKGCNKRFISTSNRIIFCSVSCSSSYYNSNLNNRITKEELELIIWSKPTVAIAKEFGCSDVAIGKLCKRLGVLKPPRGYWMIKNRKT